MPKPTNAKKALNQHRQSTVRLSRVPILLLGISCLVGGVWGGLVRLPLILPLPGSGANWITYHGPLMVCGFLGTVVSLERAVGLRAWWTYCPPLLIGLGSVLLLAGYLGRPPVTLISIGSFLFFLVTLYVIRLQPVAFTIVMSSGAFAWTVGNVLWLFDWPFNRVVCWWIAFLCLTILGERLDLSRFQKQSPWSRPLLIAALFLTGTSLILTTRWEAAGQRVFGVSLFVVACWLGRFDIARRTVRQKGLARFMALALLVGYVWLGFSGLLMVLFSPLTTGFRYDSVLHSFFVGFVFSMIFAHAPVIFPAVLMVQPAFHSRFYAHVVLLQLGLVLRVSGDLSNLPGVRRWGAILNAIAIAMFLLNTASALLFRKSAQSLDSGQNQNARPVP